MDDSGCIMGKGMDDDGFVRYVRTRNSGLGKVGVNFCEWIDKAFRMKMKFGMVRLDG